jgi:hypothetical protein
MIIGFFRDNQPFTYILLFLIALLLWGGAFAHVPYVALNYKMPLFDLVAHYINVRSYYIVLFTFITIIGTSIIINYTVNKYDILTKHSTLPALLYVLLMSCTDTLITLHPAVLANFFIALSFNRVFATYKQQSALTQLFDAGLLLGIASLFYLPSVLIYLALIVALIIFNTFNWRQWVVTFLGLITPYLIVLSYYFYTDKLGFFWEQKIMFPLHLSNDLNAGTTSTYVLLAILFFVCTFSVVKLFDEYSSYTIKTRQALSYLLWFSLCAFASVFVAPTWTFKDFALLALPFSIVISNYFINITREWMAETLFIMLLSCAVFIHYF